MKFGNSSASRRAARSELGKRDRQILADVIRYRLTTNDFVHRRYFAHAQANAVVKVTGRLVRQNWLTAHPLLDRQQYFMAGSRLTKLHGLPASRSKPLGPQALTTHYAIAKYCFTANLPLTLVDSVELQAAFPWISDELGNGTHVIEQANSALDLRLVRTDLGGTAEHIAKKCVQDIANRQKNTAFNALVSEKRFVLVVLTASPAKRQLIQQAIAKRQWPRGMRIQVFTIPELAQFVSYS